MSLYKSLAAFSGLALISLAAPVTAQIMNYPASDQLGAEDIWQNPTFVGGITNGGTAAFSEW
ncbi:MAG: hypothetical protein P8M72_09445 [Gammaproteobacteria bacterium]|nr:hypothetical protein [Gammaproteobacteria bacterium]